MESSAKGSRLPHTIKVYESTKNIMKSNFTKIEISDIALMLFSIALTILTYKGLFILAFVAFAPALWLVAQSRMSYLILVLWAVVPFSVLMVLLGLSWKLLVIGSSLIMLVFGSYFFLIHNLFRKFRAGAAALVLSAMIVYIPLVLLIQKIPIYGGYWFNWGVFAPWMFPITWVFGSFGVGAFLMGFNALVASFFLWPQKGIKTMSAILAFIALCFLLSGTLLFEKTPTVSVGVVQADDPTSGILTSAERFANYEKMSKNMTSLDLVVWPENAIPRDLENANLTEATKKLSKELDSSLVIGAEMQEREKVFNTAYQFEKGKLKDYYHARMPFPYFFVMDAGTGSNLIHVSNITQLAIITCFEETQHELIRQTIDENVGFLLSISNNEHFDDSDLLRLMRQYPLALASENARYLVRATKTGYTLFVSPTGRILAQLPQKVEATAVFDVPLLHWTTPYTRYGNLPLIFAWFLLVITLVVGFRKK